MAIMPHYNTYLTSHSLKSYFLPHCCFSYYCNENTVSRIEVRIDFADLSEMATFSSPFFNFAIVQFDSNLVIFFSFKARSLKMYSKCFAMH